VVKAMLVDEVRLTVSPQIMETSTPRESEDPAFSPGSISD